MWLAVMSASGVSAPNSTLSVAQADGDGGQEVDRVRQQSRADRLLTIRDHRLNDHRLNLTSESDGLSVGIVSRMCAYLEPRGLAADAVGDRPLYSLTQCVVARTTREVSMKKLLFSLLVLGLGALVAPVSARQTIGSSPLRTFTAPMGSRGTGR